MVNTNEVTILPDIKKPTNGIGIQHDLFNPPQTPSVQVDPASDLLPMHMRRSILRGAAGLASHYTICDLDKWLLIPLKACGNIAPIEMARDHWCDVQKWVRTLFLTPVDKRVYILTDDPKAQMDMSKMLDQDRILLRPEETVRRSVE
jgi:hypothetical protein